MKKGTGYKKYNNLLLINVYPNQTFTLLFRPKLPYIESSPLIYKANQWASFYTMATLD